MRENWLRVPDHSGLVSEYNHCSDAKNGYQIRTFARCRHSYYRLCADLLHANFRVNPVRAKTRWETCYFVPKPELPYARRLELVLEGGLIEDTWQEMVRWRTRWFDFGDAFSPDELYNLYKRHMVDFVLVDSFFRFR